MICIPETPRLAAVPAPASRHPVAADLTRAECIVLQLLLEGLANKEIASALNKAEPTVKHQVSSILRKHGQPSRARLIAVLRS